MTLKELEQKVPELTAYTGSMPEEIRSRCTIRIHPAGSLIHQKDTTLKYFGIVAQGENRVINELENGNVYMIERNKAIDFIGEVTLLADLPKTSVTIEAVTDNVVAYVSLKDAKRWLREDMNILRLAARHTARKLYRSSYNNGAKLFYPPDFLLLDYLIKYGSQQETGRPDAFPMTINRTRQMLQEETGINVKTLNRVIRQLKEEGGVSLCKGKITLSQDQYQRALARRDQQKDGD